MNELNETDKEVLKFLREYYEEDPDFGDTDVHEIASCLNIKDNEIVLKSLKKLEALGKVAHHKCANYIKDDTWEAIGAIPSFTWRD